MRWTKAYLPDLGDSRLEFSSIVPVADGYLLAGELTAPAYDDPIRYTPGVVLVRIGSDGAVRWVRHHPGFGVGAEFRHTLDFGPAMARLVIGADGRPILGTYQLVPNAYQAHPEWKSEASAVRIVTAVVDLAYGGLQSVRSYGVVSPPDGVYESPTQGMSAWGFQAMAVAPNGDLVIAHGINSGDGFSNLGLWAIVTRLSPDGSVIWSQRLAGGYEPNGYVDIRSIAFDGDDIVLAGSTTEFLEADPIQRHQNVMLMRVSGDGDVLWLRSIGVTRRIVQDGPAVERGLAMVTGTDGSIFVAGVADSFATDGLFDLLFIRAGRNGAFTGDAELTNVADFGNPQKAIWAAAIIGRFSAPVGPGARLTLDVVTLFPATTDAGLRPEPVTTDCATRTVTVRDKGLTLRSTCSMFDLASDPDGDGLDQGFENDALALVSPLIEVDEEEDWLEYRANYDWIDRIKPSRELHHVALFTRVYPWPSRADVRWVLFLTAVAWSYDYGSGVTSTPILTAKDHRGDSEKIFEAWRVVDAHTLRLEWVQTSAHDGNTEHNGIWSATDRTCNRGSVATITDTQYGTELMCGEIQFADSRVLVQASEDKHAIYPTKPICAAVNLIGDELWRENCGWEPSTIPIISIWQWKEKDFAGDPEYKGHGVWKFINYNVGEPDRPHQLINDLSRPETWLGVTEGQRAALTDDFPNESIWDGNLAGEEGFCGGLDTDWTNDFQYAHKCSGTIGDKFKLSRDWPNDRKLFEALDTYYRVAITTGEADGADTGARVRVYLAGDMIASEYVIDGEFANGQTDVFSVAPSAMYGLGGSFDQAVGIIRSVRLRVDDRVTDDRDPDWLVTAITVENLATGRTWNWASGAGRWVRANTPETFVETP